MSNEEKILELLARHEDTFKEINQTLARHEDTFNGINQTLAKHEDTFKEINQTLAEMQSEMSEMHDLLQKVSVTQEGVVLPRLDLLAEGHQTLLETLAPKDRVEALEEDVDTLKTVVRLLTHDVAELKKAQ